MTTKTSKSNKPAKTSKAANTASAAKTTKDTKAANTTSLNQISKATSSSNTDKTAKKVSPVNQESIQKVRDLIKGIKIAMLTTMNGDGVMHSRPMGTQEVEFDGDLWFFTQSNSQKMNEIKKEQSVNVSYSGDNRYVSVAGTALIVTDKAKMKELWSPIYKIWFPDGLEDPTLRLLKVSVNQVEYWDTPGGIVATIIGFAESLINKEPSKMGENETITLRK